MVLRVLVAALLSLLALPTRAGGLAILHTVLEDNGDDDGFADTSETVGLRLMVRNTSGAGLSDVVVTLTVDETAPVCLVDPTIWVGDLAAGESRLTDPVGFTVGGVDRSALALGPWDPLFVTFDVAVTSAPEDQDALPSSFVLDLDLDASGGSGPTTFFESFEGTLGAFEPDNMDQGRSSLAGSDGFRCQSHDPDWVNSYIYGLPIVIETCYLGTTPLQADAVFWGLSGPGISPLGGRGFSGFHSLFFGIDLGPPLNWTTPMQVLEAATTSEPIHLTSDDAPSLSFLHQTSFFDIRTYEPSGEDRAVDRAVVMVQLADDRGDPVGPWARLEPHQNVYDRLTSEFVANCMFDPVDDGNTEDDFFDPADPARLYGPSSTCFPEYTFAFVGETSSPFDAGNVGDVDGPGLAGQWGIGTWIESRFDLSRFRGRSIRLRFLSSMIRGNAFEADDTWEDLFHLNPDPGDDGWWVDDVTLTGVLQNPAVVSVDSTDNSALPGDPDMDGIADGCDNCEAMFNPGQQDADFDGAGTLCDCDDDDSTIYPGAIEINDGIDNNCPGDGGHGLIDETSGDSGFHTAGDKNEYSWPVQPGAVRYQVARASSATFGADCTLFPDIPVPFLIDPDQPLPGVVHFYLNRASDPNVGSWGQGSSAMPRTVPCD